jgi:hypothetical protein
MPLFMDVHNVDGGVSAGDVAGAQQGDAAAAAMLEAELETSR